MGRVSAESGRHRKSRSGHGRTGNHIDGVPVGNEIVSPTSSAVRSTQEIRRCLCTAMDHDDRIGPRPAARYALASARPPFRIETMAL
jgi:hypothetical protein